MKQQQQLNTFKIFTN